MLKRSEIIKSAKGTNNRVLLSFYIRIYIDKKFFHFDINN